MEDEIELTNQNSNSNLLNDNSVRSENEERDTNRLYDSIIYNSCTYSNQGKDGVFVSTPVLEGIQRPMFCGTEDHYTGIVRGKYDMIKVTTLILYARDDPILITIIYLIFSSYLTPDQKSLDSLKQIHFRCCATFVIRQSNERLGYLNF